jgi:hypothetical protein
MRVETVSPAGASSWALGLVGVQSERFRRVTLTEAKAQWHHDSEIDAEAIRRWRAARQRRT